MAETPESGLGKYIGIIRRNLDKVLIILSAVAIAVSAYSTFDHKRNLDCQVKVLAADRKFTEDFSSAMVILLSQPPAPAEQRRMAFERVRDSLVAKRQVQAELNNCE